MTYQATDNWHGCYREGWKGIITEESFAHPAKVSYSLAERIYNHLQDESWIQRGSLVVDPFGGIGGFALHAMLKGYEYWGVELEQKFVDLAWENFTRWMYKYRAMRGCGTAHMLQGNSRRLKEVIAGQCEVVCSSPPFQSSNQSIDADFLASRAASHRNGSRMQPDLGSYGTTPGQLGAMKEGEFEAVISSPPFMEVQKGGPLAQPDAIYSGDGRKFGKNHGYQNQGDSPDNLGNMKGGDFEAVVSSPPYEGSLQNHTTGSDAGKGMAHRTETNGRDKWGANANGSRSAAAYGVTRDNLGNMKGGDFEAVVSSPPYEGSEGTPSLGSVNKDAWGTDGHSITTRRGLTANYGKSNGQIDHTTGPIFWSASKEIVQQCYDLLAPGGHAVWVVKSFVRKGKIVDFPGQWRQLCESVGFVTLHEHHAMLVEETEHDTLFNGREVTKKERKSFFRRLHEKKNPATAIDWETVYCMVKL